MHVLYGEGKHHDVEKSKEFGEPLRTFLSPHRFEDARVVLEMWLECLHSGTLRICVAVIRQVAATSLEHQGMLCATT